MIEADVNLYPVYLGLYFFVASVVMYYIMILGPLYFSELAKDHKVFFVVAAIVSLLWLPLSLGLAVYEAINQKD